MSVDLTMENIRNPKGVGIIVVQDNHILLCQRTDSGLWGLPGGSIEPGEEPKEAAIRELFEETGIKVDDLTYYGVTPSPANPFKPKDSSIGCSIEYFVELTDKDIDIKLQPRELKKFVWVSTKNICAYDYKQFYPNSLSSLRLYLQHRPC